MTRRLTLSAEYPLRKFFRKALDFGFHENSTAKPRVGAYNKEQHLCEFILSDSLYKIKRTLRADRSKTSPTCLRRAM